MLKKIPILITFFLVTYIIEIEGTENCDKLGVLLYEEIGCKPIKDKSDDLCPSKYDCQHFYEPGDHCLFQGKRYKNRDTLPGEALRESCRGGCFCNTAPLGYFFRCAAYDCPEFLGGSPLLNKDCLRTYKLGSCCSNGQICPPFDNITMCNADGVTYKEGQKFDPKNTCSSCICQKGFDGKHEAPFCKRKSCAVEIRHSDDIKNKCAPVYHKDSVRCCPYSLVCPSKSDVLTPAPKEDAHAKTCKYGEKEIRSGQVLQTSLEQWGQKHQIKCDCQLPPLLTCIIEHSKRI